MGRGTTTGGDDGGGGAGGGGGGGAGTHQPIPGDPDNPNPDPGTEPQPRIFQLDGEVVATVNDALNNDQCRSLLSRVTPPPGGYSYGDFDPRTVFSKTSVVKSLTPNSQHPDWVASAPLGQGASSNPQVNKITTYPSFETTGQNNVFGFLPPNNGLTQLPSDDQVKAMVVLHEIAHLTGALNHDPAGSKEFDLLILERCFGINRIPV